MLSTEVILTPIEKIQLARTYQVAIWLEEGVASLVSPDNTSTHDELAALGYKTAFEVLWIQNQALRESSDTFRFRKDSIKCASCSSSSSLLGDIHNCCQCTASLVADEELSFPGSLSTSALDYLVRLGSIKCSKCSGNAFSGIGALCCTPCGSNTYYGSNVRVTPKKMASEMVKEIFGEELESYRFVSDAA